MILAKREQHGWLRSFLILDRVSLLPTVWSNCLAGWLLSGGGRPKTFLVLWVGVTCLYLGGLMLNNAWDAPDAKHYRERLGAAGDVPAETAGLWSLGWCGLGALFMVSLGTSTAVLTVVLLGCLTLYHMVYRLAIFSPVLRAICRFLLYLLAGSAAVTGLAGLTIWSGLALGFYVLGFSYLAYPEDASIMRRYWPAYLLASPFLLAWIVNGSGYRRTTLWLTLALVAWILWCLRLAFWAAHRNPTRAACRLSAGIILVDMLALDGGSFGLGAVFALWFVTTLVLQHFAPAS